MMLRQIPSPNYGGPRAKILWIIVHTAEGALTVDSLGNYFANPASGVSSHVGIDDHGIAQYVGYDKQAWAARSANPMSDQAELCGFAAWTRAQWLSHAGMLENTAQWIADRCRARGIPAVKIGPGNVAARQAGVIGHVDITNGLHDGTHTDPGPNFPWDVVMARVNAILTPQLPAQERDVQLTDQIPDFDAQARTKNPAATISVGAALANALQQAAHANTAAAQALAVAQATAAEVAKIAAKLGA